ncbi:hypothetical protein, partial [Brucella melitensis]
FQSQVSKSRLCPGFLLFWAGELARTGMPGTNTQIYADPPGILLACPQYPMTLQAKSCQYRRKFRIQSDNRRILPANTECICLLS